MKKHYGFTLMELTVAIVILGILSTLSVNAYLTIVERGRWTEAREVLLKAYAGYQRALDDGVAVVNNATIWFQLGMSDPGAMTDRKFEYTTNLFPRVKAERLPGGSNNYWTINLQTGASAKSGNAPNF